MVPEVAIRSSRCLKRRHRLVQSIQQRCSYACNPSISCSALCGKPICSLQSRLRALSPTALGSASRWQLGRMWLFESLLLSLAGAALGSLFAVWVARLLLLAISTPSNTVVLALGPDWRLIAFASGVAIASAVMFGLAPALRATRNAPIDALRAHGRDSERGNGRISGALVIAQVALSLMLVAASGLFLQTFRSLAGAHLGFDPSAVLLVNVNTTPARVEPTARLPLFEQIQREILLVNGVDSVAFSPITPIGGNSLANTIEVIGEPPPPANQRGTMTNFVSPDWFSTYSIPPVAGRDISNKDHATGPSVVIVNEAFARKFLNGQNPVGSMMREVYVGDAGKSALREIVGMVADARYDSLRELPSATMYRPIAQLDPLELPQSSMSFSVRTGGSSPANLAAAITATVRKVNPDLAVMSRPMQAQIAGALNRERLLAVLSGFFSVLALVLASVGLYGVTSYGVNRRRAELGIRIALGATRRNVVGLVLKRVALLIGSGVVLGSVLSWWAARYIAPSLLFGLAPRDPTTMMGAGLVNSSQSVCSQDSCWRTVRGSASCRPDLSNLSGRRSPSVFHRPACDGFGLLRIWCDELPRVSACPAVAGGRYRSSSDVALEAAITCGDRPSFSLPLSPGSASQALHIPVGPDSPRASGRCHRPRRECRV